MCRRRMNNTHVQTMPPTLLLRLALSAVIAGSLTVATEANATSNPAITVEAGELPIILTAPHGGRDAIPGASERAGNEAARFTSKADLNTDKIAEKLADALEQKLGRRPYVVIARFHRKYLDANRGSEDAYESAEAKAVYEAYHAAIESARREVISRWGRGVLLDIHGQALLPGAVLRGTQNGKTASHLVSRSGREALYGETSLFGQLAKQDFTVVPPIGSIDLEHPKYNGGYTVGTHGSASGGTVDAIQLELGRGYRDTEAVSDTADKLANAIAIFAKKYLPVEAQQTRAGDGSKRTQRGPKGSVR